MREQVANISTAMPGENKTTSHAAYFLFIAPYIRPRPSARAYVIAEGDCNDGKQRMSVAQNGCTNDGICGAIHMMDAAHENMFSYGSISNISTAAHDASRSGVNDDVS
jgi:hypothetical protein